MRTRLTISGLLLLAATLPAGTIVTTDGDSVTGDIKKNDDGWTVTAADGKVTHLLGRQVKTIELSGASTKPGHAAEGLASLRRSIDGLTDLDVIVRRYKAFIEQTKDPAVVADARQDLAAWQIRQDQGLVKAGRDWVTPDQRDQRNRDLRTVAESIRVLLKTPAKDREADTAITDLLTVDPQNTSGLYLRGVLSLRHGQLPEARKAFDSVRQAIPDHAPTLQNVAIIAARTRTWPAGCTAMEQALAAAPGAQVLLDTAAEYLNLLPAEVRRSGAAQKLTRTFLAQDAALQKKMAVRGLYRWGGSWIDQAAHDKITQQAADVQKKINDLQQQFTDTQSKISRCDSQINDNTQSMQDIESHSYIRAADGTLLKAPLPQAWYDLSEQNGKLKSDKNDAEGKLDSLRNDAKSARASLPQPTYTGTLDPIGEDGVPLPVIPVDANASQPAPPITMPPPATAPGNTIRVGPPDAVR